MQYIYTTQNSQKYYANDDLRNQLLSSFLLSYHSQTSYRKLLYHVFRINPETRYALRDKIAKFQPNHSFIH